MGINEQMSNHSFDIQKFTTATVHALSISVRTESNDHISIAKNCKGLACIVEKKFILMQALELRLDMDKIIAVIFSKFVEETVAVITYYYQVMSFDRVNEMLRQVHAFIKGTVEYWFPLC